MTIDYTSTLFVRHIARQRRAAHCANMRAAKARKRMENQTEREPKFTRKLTCLEFGVRDTRNGDTVWLPLVSVRDMTRRIASLARYYF